MAVQSVIYPHGMGHLGCDVAALLVVAAAPALLLRPRVNFISP